MNFFYSACLDENTRSRDCSRVVDSDEDEVPVASRPAAIVKERRSPAASDVPLLTEPPEENEEEDGMWDFE
jgi:hypothetical protein